MRRFIPFPKGICPKVNVMAQLESSALTITPRGHPYTHTHTHTHTHTYIYIDIYVERLRETIYIYTYINRLRETNIGAHRDTHFIEVFTSRSFTELRSGLFKLIHTDLWM